MAPAGTPKPDHRQAQCRRERRGEAAGYRQTLDRTGRGSDVDDPGRVRQIPARRYCEMGRSRQEIRQAAIRDRKPRFRSRCRAFDFASMASRPTVDADPDRSLLDILRGQLGMTGPHFGCGAGECGACNVIDRRPRGSRLRHAAVVGRGQGHHDDRRAGKRRAAASAAARLYRRAGDAMRLLRLRHPDERGGAVEAKSRRRPPRT